MKLIFVVFKLNFESGGGACYEVDAKINALLKLGHTATVITLFSSQNKLPADLKYKIVEENIGSHSLLNIQKKVCALLRKYEKDADIFNVDGQFGYGSGWYRWRGGITPVVVHFNRELSSFPDSTRKADLTSVFSVKKKIRFIFERFFCFPLLNHNSLFTFTSPILLEFYIRFGLKRLKAMVMPDFFNSHEFLKQINQPQVLNMRSQQKSQWTILSGGRLVSEKGLDVVIKAFAKLNNPKRFKLIITGEGPEKENLIKLAKGFGIAKVIDFTGWVSKEQNYNLFKQTDFYVVPRWRPELTSMIVLEAMAFMVPYVVTKNTALAWQAQNSALVYNDEDSVDLADKIVRLADDPNLRINLIKNGLRRVEELDCVQSARRLNEVIENLKKTP